MRHIRTENGIYSAQGKFNVVGNIEESGGVGGEEVLGQRVTVDADVAVCCGFEYVGHRVEDAEQERGGGMHG